MIDKEAATAHNLDMPSILADFISEPVSLVSSDTSPYEPPHRSSQEKPSRRSSGANGTLLNGFAVDGSGTSKKIDGVFFTGPKGANSSLNSLPNGRTSDSMDGRGKPHSRDESDCSIASGANGVGETGRRSPGPASVLTKSSVTDNVFPPVQMNGSAVQPSRPRSPEQGQIGSGPRGHSRAHSSSAPQSHTTSTSPLNPAGAASQAFNGTPTSSIDPQPLYKNPTPQNPQNTVASHVASSSLSSHPTAPRLQHRHTLQVPKVSNIRTSREFSSPVKTSSEDADVDAERLSPTHGVSRGSMSLAQRPTRSVQSDVNLDEIPQDGDMARWTETIRQKRASRRQKKEEEEDDRVVVGTKVDMNHVNWVTAYNMLTGIRFTVSRTNAKLDRELVDADFDARHKFSFDM